VLGACAEASVRPADADTLERDAGVRVSDASAERVSTIEPDDASYPADAASLRAGPLPACTAAIAACPYAPRAGAQPLLKAASFGDGARLVDVGADAVLVARADGTYGVALLPPPASSMPAEAVLWPLDTGAWTPIKVRSALASFDAGVYVLACAAQERTCLVFSAQRDRQELSAFTPLLALPERFQARGLAMDESAEGSVPCVYGNGLLCLSYGWREEIAIADGLRLNDVTIVGSAGLAVGDHGRWFKRRQEDTAPGVWSEFTPLADVSLTFANILNDMAIVLGDGQIQALLGWQSTADLPCAPPGPIDAAWLYYGGALFVMANGDFIQHVSPTPRRADPDCRLYQLPAGAVLAHSEHPCGLAQNEHVLKADALWGGNGCPID
jgi:hypothetical protein